MADPVLEIDIRIDAGIWRGQSPDILEIVDGAARAALADSWSGGAAELSLLLTDDTAIADLNREWRGREGATNVLSFPTGDEPAAGRAVMLGDVIVACETLAREAEQAGIPFADHLRHLIVHGVLHLLGYDHENDADATEMESREIAILATLGVPDPYRAEETMEERIPS